METYQDFQSASGISSYYDFIMDYKSSDIYKTAADAELYDRQQNSFINNFTRFIYTANGRALIDESASNYKIASNFFHRLNVQLCTYVLGAGVKFNKADTKDKLGAGFENVLYSSGYNALIHGVTFLFWNNGKVENFKATEFVPFFDEETGALMAGIRFWRLASDKPLMFTVYDIDGYTSYEYGNRVIQLSDKRAYKLVIRATRIGEILSSIGENYPSFPIVPFYGSRLKQSTLVGMKQSIDSYDLIRSGFANDLADVAQIYWIINGADGMDKDDLREFRQKLLFNHVATVTGDESVKITPYSKEVPHMARTSYLEQMRQGIYEDFGGVDVKALSGGSNITNVEIEASYQALNENADDFEFQILKALGLLFELAGIDDAPTFNRSKEVNIRDKVETVLSMAQYLDVKTILEKSGLLSTEEIDEVMQRKRDEDEEAESKISGLGGKNGGQGGQAD